MKHLFSAIDYEDLSGVMNQFTFHSDGTSVRIVSRKIRGLTKLRGSRSAARSRARPTLQAISQSDSVPAWLHAFPEKVGRGRYRSQPLPRHAGANIQNEICDSCGCKNEKRESHTLKCGKPSRRIPHTQVGETLANPISTMGAKEETASPREAVAFPF